MLKKFATLKWHRRLIAKKWTFKQETKPGRPPTGEEITNLILQFARENPSWGYDRIQGALQNLGHTISDQTIGNILKKHGLGPATERKRHTTWKAFIKRHNDVLMATDFFSTEVWTAFGLTTYYVLFFINLATKRVTIAGCTTNPTAPWIEQVTRNIAGDGIFKGMKFLLHDRDTKFTKTFDILRSEGVRSLKLPPSSPNLNAVAERWVRSIKEECLDQMILFGENSLRHVLKEYVAHFHAERNHQGIDNVIPFPDDRVKVASGQIVRHERIGGLLNFYHRKAA